MASVATASTAGLPIEQVIADLHREAAVLRANGHGGQADTIEHTVERIVKHPQVQELLGVLSEEEARLYSGYSVERLRAQFPQWEARGLARVENKRREYRRCALRHRGNAEAAREAGRRAARAS